MNFILANCKHGQRKLGVEYAPTIIYNSLLFIKFSDDEIHNKTGKYNFNLD